MSRKSEIDLAAAFTTAVVPEDAPKAVAKVEVIAGPDALPPPEPELTPEEKRLQYLLGHPPETREEFLTFVEEVLGHEFKTGLVMALEPAEEGHEPPIDWMWEAWCMGWGRSSDGNWRKLSGKEQGEHMQALLLHGPRGGMKTLALAALWFMLCWFIPGYTVTHTATQKHQAQQCVGYLHGWAKSPTFLAKMHKPLLKEVAFHNNSSIVVLTASLDGLNAPHTLSISVDEVETLDPTLLDQALQIQQEQPGFGFPSLVILASTQKRATLGMSKLIKEAIKKGSYRYITWNVWDVCEACPSWRREDVEDKGVRCSDYGELAQAAAALELKAETDPLHPMEIQKLEVVQAKLMLLQGNCPLVGDCRGKAVRGSGHLAINTLIFRIQNLDRATWEAENLCTRPSVEGAVYAYLSPENQSEDAIYREEGRIIAGIDYGFVDKSIIVLGCEHRIFVDLFYEFEGENYFEEDLVARAKELQRMYHVSKWIVGNDAIKLVKMLRRAGLNAVRSSRKAKLAGCDHVARLILDGTGVRRLRYHPTNAYATFEQMQGYQRKKNSNEPKDGDDDYCLVAGTMIRTEHGDVPIEKIAAGDCVLTRHGYRPVLASCETSESADVLTVHFSNGTYITGTPNHPVYVLGRGYIALRALRYNDVCLSVQLRRLTPSFIAASPFAATRRVLGSVIAAITSQVRAILGAACLHCIKRFGRTRTGQSPKVIRSTIGTSTRSTMLSRIWSAFAAKNTARCTKPYLPTNNCSGALTDSLPRRNHLLLNGITQTPAVSFTANLASGAGKLGLAWSAPASNAERSTLLGSECMGASVPIIANQPGAEPPALITSREPALSAGLSSFATDTRQSRLVPLHVLRVVSEPLKQAVYNLSVDADPGEYFANGILTHNCDALRYLAEDVKIRLGQGTRIMALPRVVGQTMGQNVVIRRPGDKDMKLRRL